MLEAGSSGWLANLLFFQFVRLRRLGNIGCSACCVPIGGSKGRWQPPRVIYAACNKQTEPLLCIEGCDNTQPLTMVVSSRGTSCVHQHLLLLQLCGAITGGLHSQTLWLRTENPALTGGAQPWGFSRRRQHAIATAQAWPIEGRASAIPGWEHPVASVYVRKVRALLLLQQALPGCRQGPPAPTSDVTSARLPSPYCPLQHMFPGF